MGRFGLLAISERREIMSFDLKGVIALVLAAGIAVIATFWPESVPDGTAATAWGLAAGFLTQLGALGKGGG
jgi:uncharacterized membrane protein YoaK (UPF0700 family)